MNTMVRRGLVAGASLVVTASSSCAKVPSQPAIRDSAGVRIVEHATIRNAPIAFTIAESPLLDLGGLQTDPRAELESRHPFHHASRLSDGRIVVADMWALKLFDSGGKILQVIGRGGQGPGEFGQLRETCVAPGDTIISIGYGDHRLSVFDATGAHLRTFTPPGRVTIGGCNVDGTMLIEVPQRAGSSGPPPGERGGIQDQMVTVQRIRSDGSLVSPAGTYPGGSTDFTFERTVNVVANGELIHAGDGRSTEFRGHAMDGKLVRIVRWKDPLIPVTQEMAEGSGYAAAEGTSAGSAPPPTRSTGWTLPAYRSIKVDPSGRVWVEDYELPPAKAPGWTVFDPSGGLLGRVTLPKLAEKIDLVAIGRDQVTLRWRDSNGAAHVSFHSFR